MAKKIISLTVAILFFVNSVSFGLSAPNVSDNPASRVRNEMYAAAAEKVIANLPPAIQKLVRILGIAEKAAQKLNDEAQGYVESKLDNIEVGDLGTLGEENELVIAEIVPTRDGKHKIIVDGEVVDKFQDIPKGRIDEQLENLKKRAEVVELDGRRSIILPIGPSAPAAEQPALLNLIPGDWLRRPASGLVPARIEPTQPAPAAAAEAPALPAGRQAAAAEPTSYYSQLTDAQRAVIDAVHADQRIRELLAARIKGVIPDDDELVSWVAARLVELGEAPTYGRGQEKARELVAKAGITHAWRLEQPAGEGGVRDAAAGVPANVLADIDETVVDPQTRAYVIAALDKLYRLGDLEKANTTTGLSNMLVNLIRQNPAIVKKVYSWADDTMEARRNDRASRSNEERLLELQTAYNLAIELLKQWSLTTEEHLREIAFGVFEDAKQVVAGIRKQLGISWYKPIPSDKLLELRPEERFAVVVLAKTRSEDLATRLRDAAHYISKRPELLSPAGPAQPQEAVQLAAPAAAETPALPAGRQAAKQEQGGTPAQFQTSLDKARREYFKSVHPDSKIQELFIKRDEGEIAADFGLLDMIAKRLMELKEAEVKKGTYTQKKAEGEAWALLGKDKETQVWVIDGNWGEARVRRLIEKLDERNADLCREALYELSEIGPAAASAVPAIMMCLKHKNPADREIAAMALGNIGLAAVDAIPALIETAKNDNSLARTSAKLSLQKIRAAAAEAQSGETSLSEVEGFAPHDATSEDLSTNVAPTVDDACYIEEVAEFLARVARGEEPGSAKEEEEALGAETTRAIFEAVNLLHNGKIEILMPVRYGERGLTDTMMGVLREVRKKHGDAINVRQYSGESHLAEMLGQVDRNTTTVVITEESMKAEIAGLLNGTPLLFRGKRVANFKFPGNYGTMDENERTVYQADIIIIGFLMGLLKNGTREAFFIRTLLMNMLENHMEKFEIPAYLDLLGEPDKENASAEEITAKIGFFLNKVIRMSGMVDLELRIMKLLWTFA